MSKQFGLPASARLKHKKAIEHLYASGTSILQFPLLLKFCIAEQPNQEPVVVMFTASKKKLLTVPARNRSKRQMREIFRRSRPVWSNWVFASHKQLQLSLIYVHQELLPSEVIEKAWLQMLKRLESQLVSSGDMVVKNSK